MPDIRDNRRNLKKGGFLYENCTNDKYSHGGGAKVRLIRQIDGFPQGKPHLNHQIDALRF